MRTRRILVTVGLVVLVVTLAIAVTRTSGVTTAGNELSIDGETVTSTLPEAAPVSTVCEPIIPGTYTGTVTVEGAQAPNGTLVQAFVMGRVWASDTTLGGRYLVDVPESLPVDPPCFEEGWLRFGANGLWCEPLVEWSPGLNEDFDLTCNGEPPFHPSFTASLSSYGPGENADVGTDFSIPAPDYNYNFAITFTPTDWFVAADADVPDGALVGSVDATSTLGLINGPCNSALPIGFDMMEATSDTSVTVTFDDQFEDANANTLPDGVDKYPEYLTRIVGYQPRARYFGQASVAGAPMSFNVLVFDPGTLSFDPGLGYQFVTVLNDNGDTGAETDPSPITDFCTPLDTDISIFGLSSDNPGTLGDEDSYVLRANPGLGTYTFSVWTQSQPDADTDGIENQIDTCPLEPNAGDPRVAGSGDDDNDGLDDVCDPTPAETKVDEDDDAYTNRQDNCPVVANGADPDDQVDSDNDGIGDACDPFPSDQNGSYLPYGSGSQVDIGLNGDTQCDGDVDAVDCLYILQNVVGTRQCSAVCPLSGGTLFCPGADTQCDADIDAVDALFCLQYVVGIRPEIHCIP